MSLTKVIEAQSKVIQLQTELIRDLAMVVGRHEALDIELCDIERLEEETFQKEG